ncbi:MAG: hypothetical protein ONA69_02560 [candidate division KSB1 bacterium]|nr:hypothetical protein [candidate division KSB1 bacterium]MDZ7345653.1 hypothetical protein [candidate division KSB1 bacterium]
MDPELQAIVARLEKTNRKPEFNNLLRILRREVPSRPTLFEFTLNQKVYEQVTQQPQPEDGDGAAWARYLIKAFGKLGYDFAVIGGWHHRALVFEKETVVQKASKSLNQGAVITNEKEFDEYPWPSLREDRLAFFASIDSELPDGMKLIACGYAGVLETVIELVGYENLCTMIYLQPELAEAIFAQVGSRILALYQRCLEYDAVGAIIANDDWGFKTQTMLPPDDLRRLVFPWYKKVVQAAHERGKPVILHSCGNLEAVMDDIIDDLKVDGKHSFEDVIFPVEEAVAKWGDRIAVIGGIDVDFIAQQAPELIRERAARLAHLSLQRGGIAVGSGNSIPEYIPIRNYCALLEAVLF